MKVFNAQGIEKDDNADVLVELSSMNSTLVDMRTTLQRSRNLHAIAARELQIANLHFAIMNDTFIEEPP